MLKCKRQANRLVACILAIVLMAGLLGGLVSVPAKAATFNSLSEYFGIPSTAVLYWLKGHENSYYLGTPYRSKDDANPESCISPNGEPNAYGPGMNCTGFLAHVFRKVGADLSAIQNYGMPGGVINATNWFGALVDQGQVTAYRYDSVEDLLASGQARKGDIIYCDPIDWSAPGADCHVGFFWGDSPSDNKFWHSGESPVSGNQISAIVPKTTPSQFFLIPTGTGLDYDPITVLLRKSDADTGQYVPQGSGSLQNAQFTVRYYDGFYTKAQVAGVTPTRTWSFKTDADGWIYFSAAYKVSGDAFYYDPFGDPAIPYGTITIQESLAPAGYVLDNTLYHQQITTDQQGQIVVHYNAPVVPNTVIRGGVLIEKWDNELNSKNPQGSGTLEGAVIEIFNRSAGSVRVSGKNYAPNAVVATLTTDASGTAQTANDLLPYGNYEAIEKASPSGYRNTGVLKRSFSITTNGVMVNLNTEGTAIKNDPIRGGVRVEKWDHELDANQEQGMATLEGATFELYNKSPNAVLVEGAVFQPGEKVYTLTTDASGVAQTSATLLPYGTYEIVETSPPTGYLSTGVLKRTFSITTHGVIVNLNASGTAIKNDPIRGGVRVEKWDNEIDEHRAQGMASLEGATFDIVNRSQTAVLVNGTLCNPGAIVHTMTTGADGVALTANDLLPYGNYEVVETSPPEGYLPMGAIQRFFQIREHGVIVDLNTSGTAIKNDPIRGDIEFAKRSEDQKTMSNILFSITSKTTGESHNFVTDENGYWSSSSDWNLHSENTNRGETEHDGIWFGDESVLDNNVGALLYDTYLIQELRCAGNEGYDLVSFEITIRRHDRTIDLGTITDKYEQTPGIETTAIDEASGTHRATVGGKTTIIDTIDYYGLIIGEEYTVEGILMNKATGKALLVDGKEVTGSATFTASKASGSIDVTFTFDSTGLAGTSTVVFETLYHEDIEIATHADIKDSGQTVTFKTIPISGKLLVNKLDFDDLAPLAGAEFTVYDADGNEVGTLITDETGWAEITLPEGSYTVKETKVPEGGYIIDNTRYPFEIDENGIEVPVTVFNSRTPGTTVPSIDDGVKLFPQTGVA